MSTSTDAPVAVTLERRFDAAPEAVFDAWTKPELLAGWFRAPGEGWSTPVAEVDLRVGGAYSLVMQTPDGTRFPNGGEYREITPHTRLSFTWQPVSRSEGHHPTDPSLVTVTFTPDGDGTLVELVHTGLETEAQREMHRGGWVACLESLDQYLG